MKKTFVMFTALAIGCATVKAQNVQFGIKAGIQQNSFGVKSTSNGEWSRQELSGVGFHVGGLADISLSKQFSVQPQLLFNSKSAAVSSQSKLNIYALDVPVNFLFKSGGFFAGVGPNFSYGLSAKSKTDGQDSQDMYKKETVEGGDDASMLKRFELGANATLGYKFSNGILIGANYTQGLSNIAGYSTANQKYHTRLVGLSVGYILGGKK
ncbi:MAG: porin family protein [Agriterribacter sp.]